MSTLANISYSDGDVVWVRLSNSWWPGEVVGESRLPEGLLASLKKQPIAVVRFFQESTFEYVYSIEKICLYNNQRKHTFIKKGLEAFRAKKKFMETFPEDVAIAEKMVNGDPDIINSDEFQPTKAKKETWSDIFVDPNKKQKTPKKDTPGQITSHRNSDYESRILEQTHTPSSPATPAGNSYKCRACPFSTNRMNVFIMHNKTHTKEDLASPKPPVKATPKSKGAAKAVPVTPKTPRVLNKSLREPKKAPIIDDFVDDFDLSDTEETSTKKKRRGKKATPAKQSPVQTPIKKSTRKTKASAEEKKESDDIKTNTEIKNELLADWSDDEAGQEEKEAVKEEPSDPRKSSELFDNLKKDEAVSSEVAAGAATSPIKCRNIPKKRDFVFDELKEDEQEVDEKKQQAEDKKKLKEEEKRKREEEKQREIERKIKEKVEKQKEKEERWKEQEEKRKQQLEEKRKLKEEKKKQQELKKKEEEAQRQAELERQKAEEAQRQAELEKRKQEEEQKRLEEEKKKAEARKKMKGDFDLLMEQLEETPPPVRVSRRNKNRATPAAVETTSKQAKIESPTPEPTKSSRKSARQATKSDEPEIGEDEALAQEIKELLKETTVPDIVKDAETDDRKLPPKERGKRIFKESKAQQQLPKGVTSPSKAMTESELLIAETLTQLPQTAIQFSPKKSLPSNKGHTSNDNDIAESLINLGTPPKTVVSVPDPVIPNPRKRHLRALEEKSVVTQQEPVEEKAEPKHEHLTKRQRLILEQQNAKVVESPTKSETRLPKKRKTEYQSEFESVVNKKLEEDRKLAAAAAAVPEKKIARKSPRDPVKTDDSLFDINNMEIVFDNNDPVASNRASSSPKMRPMSLSPIKFTKHSPTKTTLVARSEPQIIQIKQDSRLSRLSPVPQSINTYNKNAEIRRLSFPAAGSKEQKLRQEITPTHRKVMKLITQPDGTRTLIEEVQPNLSRASPTTATTPTTTHSLIVRASSSSPLAKSQRSMTQSPILTTTSRSSGTPKPQVIVGAASNKIIITSKGSLMTTTSPVTSTTARISSNIRPANKIQVQSEIIIPSSRVTSRIIDTPVTTVRKEIVYSSSQKKPTTIAPSSITGTTSKDKPSKSNVIKLSPQQLREAESLGYVEMRGNGKVLTKAGLKEFLPKINPNFKKRKDSDASLEASSSSGSLKSVDNSVICLDGDESPQKAGPVVTQPKQKPIYKSISNDPIVIPDEEPATSASSPVLKIQKSTSPPVVKVTKSVSPPVIKKVEEKIVPVSVPPVQQESPVKQVVTESKSDAPVVTATTPTPTKENNNLNDQNTQILAVPAENFGGPANAFYLCSVGEDGSFTPMNSEALYLDASNQLVPMMPDTPEKGDAGTQDETPGEDNQDGTSEVGGQSIILNTGDGQQIILDQQSLLAMAVSGDVSQLFTQDGQQLILPGSAQEILNAIAASQNELGDQPILLQAPMVSDQDILATALANTEVFQQDQLLDLNPPVKAHVSETNTVLTQSPIMSTSEQPTKNNGNVEVSSELSKNLDEKLAEIGVTQHQTNVPVSLELPITVTNPAIAPKTTTNPLEINTMYPATALGVAVSSTLSSQDISPALVGILPTTTTTTTNDETDQNTSSNLNSAEVSDEFIPDTPEEPSNHQDTEDTNSSEIPIQPNIVTTDAQIESNGNDLKNNGDLGETETDSTTNGLNNNSEEKQEFIAPIDICDIPLPPDEAETAQQQSSTGGTLETLNDQMEVDES